MGGNIAAHLFNMGGVYVKNLACVKSIVTMVLTVALVIAVFMFPSTYEETFKNAVTMVVTFYFAHQSEKKEYERKLTEIRKEVDKNENASD